MKLLLTIYLPLLPLEALRPRWSDPGSYVVTDKGDYRYLGLTLDRHPLSFLRERLSKKRFVPSDVLAGFSNGQLARACGIVTVRQRPSTANGVVFITIEDETGNVNVICWPSLVDEFRREVMGAQLLGVYGVWQCESNVKHLVAKRLVDLSHILGELDTRSRDFH